jgi:hypothetical protein
MTPLQGAALGAMTFLVALVVLAVLMVARTFDRGNVGPALVVNSVGLLYSALVVYWNLGRLG